MTYADYLIKIGETTIPNTKIEKETYSVKPSASIIIDDIRTADGVRHVTTYDHQPTVIKFSFKRMLVSDLATVYGWFSAAYTNAFAKILPVTYYDPLTDAYKTGSFILSNMEVGVKVAVRSILMYNNVDVTLEEL